MRKLSHYWQKRKKQVYQELIIKRNVPWHKQPHVLIALSGMILSILGSYFYLNYALEDTLKQLTSMSRRYNSLSEKYLEVKIAKIKLQRELEIAKQSTVKIKDNLLTMHEQSQELTEQVDLYKRIMANKSGDEQVLIENVQIRQVDNTNEYNLSFLMLQASKNKSLLQGSIDVKFKGKTADIAKTLNYSKLAGNKNLNYRFRDYQKINERIQLPAEFKVEEVIIAVTDHLTKQTKTRNFDWDLVGGQEINVAQK